MDQIEIILRTTDPSGKVTEQILAKFDTEEPAIGSDKVLQYSGLCIYSGFLSAAPTWCLLWNGGRRAKR